MTANKQTKKQTNKQEAEKIYIASETKSFSSRLAKPETAPPTQLRLFMDFVRELLPYSLQNVALPYNENLLSAIC